MCSMVETENIKPTESQGQRDEPQVRVSQVKEKREVSLRHSRRIVLVRRLLLPVLGTVLLVVFVLVGREFTNRRERINGLRDLQKKIETYKKEHNGRLPYRSEVSQFELSSRIKAEGIAYEDKFIHDKSPSNAPVAYTKFLPLHFFTSGHAVLDKSGKVEWLTSDELEERIKQRNQYHNYHNTLIQERLP